MGDGLCTVPPWGRAQAVPRAWITLRAAHTAHSPDDRVTLFSMSKFKQGNQSGPVLG